MAREGVSKHGGRRKYGRNKDKCQQYENEGRRETHKMVKIMRNSGAAALEAWKQRFIYKTKA